MKVFDKALYAQHAKTCAWLVSKKGYKVKAAVKSVAKKHGLIQTKLEPIARGLLPSDLLSERKRAAQSNWKPPPMAPSTNKPREIER